MEGGWRGEKPAVFALARTPASRCNTSVPASQTIRWRYTGPPPYLHVVVVLVLKYNYKKVKMSREKGCDVVV